MGSADKDDYPLKGTDKVVDRQVKAEDSNLFSGRCDMTGYSAEIRVRKGPEIKKTCYNILRNFQHNTCIRHLHFYPEGNMGRLVIPPVKSSFDKWMKKEAKGQRLLFKDDGTISILFKTMIGDLCDVVEKLYENEIMINNLQWRNLYIADEDTPRLLLLITEAERVSKVSNIVLWKPVMDIIKWCCDECDVQLNYAANRYVDFIGKSIFSVKSLMKYPDNWDYDTKGDYLILAMRKCYNLISRSMQLTEIQWPLDNGDLPGVLSEIIKYQRNRTPDRSTYCHTIRFRYIWLVRDTFKHFIKYPQHIKMMFGSQEGFLKKVEHWSPTIWMDLYDITGWP